MTKRKRKRTVKRAKQGSPFELGEQHVQQSLARINDPMLRYLLCMMLDRLSQQIAAFENGSAALQLTKDVDFN